MQELFPSTIKNSAFATSKVPRNASCVVAIELTVVSMEHHSSVSDILKDPKDKHRHRSMETHFFLLQVQHFRRRNYTMTNTRVGWLLPPASVVWMREMQSNRNQKLSPFGADAFEGIVTVTEI